MLAATRPSSGRVVDASGKLGGGEEAFLNSPPTILRRRAKSMSFRVLHDRSSGHSGSRESGGGGDGPPVVVGGLMVIFFVVFVIAACFGRSRGMSRREIRRRGDAEVGDEEEDDDHPSRMIQVAYARSSRGSSSGRQKQAQQVDFKQLLEATTMQVKTEDLVQRNETHSFTETLASLLFTSSSPNLAASGSSDETTDVELGGDDGTNSNNNEDTAESNQKALQLPPNKPNAQRLVPSSCAICLSSFQVGETVSWSDSPSCSHAFHTACIVQYATSFLGNQKKENREGNESSDGLDGSTVPVPCPLCRSPFVCYDKNP